MSANSRAQELPPELVEFITSVRQILPAAARVTGEYHWERDLEDEEGELSWQVYEVGFPFYLWRLGDQSAISLGVNYALVDLDLNANDITFDGQIHELFLPISYVKRLGGGEWFFLGRAAPGLRTDFDHVGGSDFAIRGFAAAMRRFTDTFSFGFGAYASYSTDGAFGAPGIGFLWQPYDGWTLSLIAPELALSWQPDEQWFFSAMARPRSFLADLEPGTASDPDFVSLQYGEASLTARRRLMQSPDLWLSLRGGFSFLSEIELERGGRSMIDGDLDPGFFLSVSLGVYGW